VSQESPRAGIDRGPRLARFSWIVVAAVAVACYAPTLAYGLLYDDLQIEASPLLSRPFDFLAVLRSEFYPLQFRTIPVYRPLSQWSFLLNWRANELLLGAGGSGFGFHLPNVLLHAAVCVLLLAWLRSLPLRAPIPFLAALLFAVHPIHVEAVANVFGRSEAMTLAFGLGFLIAHRGGSTILAAFLYLLAAWSKESGIAFLGVALLADLLFPAGERPLPLRRHVVYACVLALWFALRAVAIHGIPSDTVFIDNPAFAVPAVERVLTAAAVQLDYLRLLVWPLSQSADYSFAQREVVSSLLDPRVLGFAAALAVAVLVALKTRARAPAVLLGVAGYAILFSVTSNFAYPIGTIEGERLAYAPSMFALLLAAVGLASLGVRRSVSLIVGSAIALVLAVLSVRAERVWRDEPTFYREMALRAPRSAKAHMSLGTELGHEGDLDGAIREYEIAVRIAPAYNRAWIALAGLRRAAGNLEGAVDAWKTALELDPVFSGARADLAVALLDLGRRAEAAAQAHELFARDVLHRRLPMIQDRLAAGASPEELSAARADLERARAALAAGDARRAVAIAQDLAAGPALPRAERTQALRVLADAWDRLERGGRAETYRKAADLGMDASSAAPDSGATPPAPRR
jgi:tetratricopeptide (TPR) repeat protein